MARDMGAERLGDTCQCADTLQPVVYHGFLGADYLFIFKFGRSVQSVEVPDGFHLFA